MRAGHHLDEGLELRGVQRQALLLDPLRERIEDRVGSWRGVACLRQPGAQPAGVDRGHVAAIFCDRGCGSRWPLDRQVFTCLWWVGVGDLYRALADPTRRAILDELTERDDQTLFELCTRLIMKHQLSSTRQAISQHLDVLEDAGLVVTRREGRYKFHSIDTAPLDELSRAVAKARGKGPSMRINLASVLVDDQAKALTFYTDTLGFVMKNDVPVGEARWLTVVSPEQSDGPELLLEPDGHPAAKPFKAALVADGIPFTSFAVADVAAEFERLRALGVRFTQEPTEMGPVTTAVFDDTCGNLIQIVSA